MKKRIIKNIKSNIVLILVLIITSAMTVGYALYGKVVNINGYINFEKPGIIEITSATILLNECIGLAQVDENAPENKNPIITNNLNLSFSLKADNSATYLVAKYIIVVENNSFYDYTFVDFPVNPTIVGSDKVPRVSMTITDFSSGQEIDPGETLKPEEKITIKLSLEFETDDSGVTLSVNGGVTSLIDNTGTLLASITPNTADLTNPETLAKFTLTIANTYKYKRNIDLTSSNDSFMIVDSLGNIHNSFFIEANETKDFELYLKIKDDSVFLSDNVNTHIIVSSNGINNIDTGDIIINVTKDLLATDFDSPIVGNVVLSIPEPNVEDGNAFISWDRIDSGGSSIINYYIELVNETTGQVNNYQTNNNVTYLLLTGLSEGTYYAKVYGEDEAGNKGSESCASATTDNGECSKSTSTMLKWVFNIIYNLNGLSTDGVAKAILNSVYEANLEVDYPDTDSLPSYITVTMGGNTLTSGTDYSYNASTGLIHINKITGDVTITASASSFCLIKGTKIRLANNTYKNIEDINYDDLLMVYDHETGHVTFEYPIWIEKEKRTDNYQRTTFSDGTVLETFGAHGIYNVDLKQFVSVTDKEKFDVGSRVYKINKAVEKEIVFVKKIESVFEETTYYHVTSTRYLNVLANDILTTDGTLVVSNMYEFNENAVWTRERINFLNKNDFFHYEDWSDHFSEFVFKGCRMEEAKIIFYKGLLNIKKYSEVLNIDNMKSPITNQDNNRVWMITTSDDVIMDKHKYLNEEGSFYILEEPKNKNNFIGWKNLADSKTYQPGEKIKVLYGMHFIALYK